MPSLDLEWIRAQFPALAQTVSGQPAVFFDGPGGTQVPTSVVEDVSDYLLAHNANTHWAYPTSAETDAALAGARQALADFVGGAPEEIVFKDRPIQIAGALWALSVVLVLYVVK